MPEAVRKPSKPAAYEIARVPEVVIGEPVTVKPVGTEAATDVTDPPPVPAPIAVLKVAASRAETVLSAFTLRNVIALGFVKVKRFEPAVVPPRLVRAAAAVVAPVPPRVSGNVPVVPASIGRPVALVKVAADGVPRFGVVRAGEVENTRLPVPVSLVTAAAKFALDGVERKVATLVPRPEIPVATGSPVALVKVAVDGVPRFGVTNVGLFVKATLPVPLSSLKIAASWAEVVKAVERPSDEVAICVKVFPAPPIKSWFWVIEERPVPPRVPAKVPVVSLRAIPKVLVAEMFRVLPLHARLVPAVIRVLGVL